MREPLPRYEWTRYGERSGAGEESWLALIAFELMFPEETPERSCVVLCSRDYSFVNALSAYDAEANYIGVDLKETPWESRLGLFPAGEPVVAGGSVAIDKTEPHGRHVTADKVHALRADAFDPAISGRIPTGNRSVYVRPPKGASLAKLAKTSPDAQGCATAIMGSEAATAEWLFATRALSLAQGAGKAVAELPARALSMARGASDRARLAEGGRVELVLRTPWERWGEPICLVVLSLPPKEGRAIVRVIDARDVGKSEKTDENPQSIARRICEMLQSNGLACTEVAIDSLAHAGWSLDPADYSRSGSPMAEGTPLGNVAEVRRGISDKQVRKIAAGEVGAPRETPSINRLRYIRASDYGDGEIFNAFGPTPNPREEPAAGAEFACPFELDSKRFRIEQGSLVLVSRIGPPFKVALARDEAYDAAGWSPHAIAVADSLISIKPAEGIDPVYLLAYLGSVRGQEALERGAGGVKFKQLTARDLREVRIPVPDTTTQEEIATAYTEHRRRLALLKRDLEDERRSRRELFGAFPKIG